MNFGTLTRSYVNLIATASRRSACAALLIATTAATAQLPDDDRPAIPAPVLETDSAEAKMPALNAIDVTPTGAIVGVEQAGGDGWVSQGPAPSMIGQVENLGPDLDFDGFTDDEVVGAVHVVLPHPVDPNIAYAGAVNGGVWKTTDALSPSPTWVPLTDFMPSLSIGALEFDPTDLTYQTVVAGVGEFSSFGVGGALTGVYRTTDGGTNWTHIDGGGLLTGLNISAVYARGNFLLVAGTEFRFGVFIDLSISGIYRSTDGGSSFELLGLFGGPNTFPTGTVFDMEGHPEDPATIYAAVAQTPGDGAGNGVYRSDDFGGTWTRVSNPRMTDLIVNFQTSNIELSMYDSGDGASAVYCAILNFGQLDNGGVFRTTNRGVTWGELPLPLTEEAGGNVGTNPTFKPDAAIPGGQGQIHFSIQVDPEVPSIVYVGGDRQPAGADDCCGFPNAIGANDFSGRLFRGDVFSTLADKWSHLTHGIGVVSKPLGGTSNTSAPHADSREMAFDAAGDLMESDDGGVYRRTLPQTRYGDWYSVNGNLAVTEMHDIAWDAVSNVLVSGNQDTGTTFQRATGDSTWISFSTADGGDVLIDDKTGLDSSTRYSSNQFLANARRSLWTASNLLVSNELLGGNGFSGSPQFRTPLALNSVDPTRIAVGNSDVINETSNRGNSFTPLPMLIGFTVVNFRVNEMDFGGELDGESNADVLWAGGVASGIAGPVPNVIVRPILETGMLITNYPGVGGGPFARQPVDLEMDPADWRICYVADQLGDILRTNDMGKTWELVSQSLGDVGVFHQIEFVESKTSRYLFVCSDLGVFFTDTDSLEVAPALAIWRELGANLPNAPVWDIEHETVDDIIAVGTMGRGGWTYPNVSDTIDRVGPRVVVYLDSGFTGEPLGTRFAPFRTIDAALENVVAGGEVRILPGNHAFAPLTLNTRITLIATGPGAARIR